MSQGLVLAIETSCDETAAAVVAAVSYTHLTLPTTPYV